MDAKKMIDEAVAKAAADFREGIRSAATEQRLTEKEQEEFRAAAKERGMTDGEIETAIALYGTAGGVILGYTLAQLATFGSVLRRTFRGAASGLHIAEGMVTDENQKAKIKALHEKAHQVDEQIGALLTEFMQQGDNLAGLSYLAGALQDGTDRATKPYVASRTELDSALDTGLAQATFALAEPNAEETLGADGVLWLKLFRQAIIRAAVRVQ